MTHPLFFMGRCAGETAKQYNDRLAAFFAVTVIPDNVTSRPIADGIGYFRPDDTLFGYFSLRVK